MSSSTELVPDPTNNGRPIQVVAFLAQGGYLVGGDDESVRLWRLADGHELEDARMVTGNVRSVATSSNSKWIVSGTVGGEVTVWDAHSHKQVFTPKDVHTITVLDYPHTITALDFSPDSTQFIIASATGIASVFEIPAGKRVVGPLRHRTSVTAAKFSPQGDRIAVATTESVPVYDSRDGSLLFDIQVKVRTYYNTGLVWSGDGQSLFVSSDHRIRLVQVSATPQPSEWPVPESSTFPCVTLPKHGKFIAYSTERTITFWDTFTHTQVGQVIQHDQDVSSISVSPDDRFLATIMRDGRVTITSIRDILPPFLFVGPFIHVGDSALDAWDQDHFAEAEVLIMEEVAGSTNPSHHSLANRAIVRARQQQWDAALIDADQSIQTQPSVLGFIARSLALVGKGERHGYQACDLAFRHCHPHYDDLLLLKAVIICMAGEHDDAISCIARLIPTADNKSKAICHLVQAYVYFLHGRSHMESGDYESAIQSFECAQDRMRGPASPHVLPISLISGWKFDQLRITIRRNLCEALFAARRVKDARESFLRLAHRFSNDIYMSKDTRDWLSDFARQLLATSGDSVGSPSENAEATRVQLWTEWVKAKLTNGQWEGALSGAIEFNVSKLVAYRIACERLEKDDHLAEAVDCLLHILHDLGIGSAKLWAKGGAASIEAGERDPVKTWMKEFGNRLSSKLEYIGNTAVHDKQYSQAIAHYSALLSLDPPSLQSLLTRRSKVFIEIGLWDKALDDANQVITRDPSSLWGHEMKRLALHRMGRYDDAIDAFKILHSKIFQLQSPPNAYEYFCKYVNPLETARVICNAVRVAIRDLPRVLINTPSGRLFDKSQQELAFKSHPMYKELISSMTTNIDHPRINHEVAQYYRYAMLSHTWEEENEPLFQEVAHAVVYELEQSPTRSKLQMFCKIVRDAGLHWAWSDTCCINKQDHVVLQEALVAMFKWYHNSAVTIVHLRGVQGPGGLIDSVWNSRAWTLQEYLAAKVIRFYTEDWTPYADSGGMLNHKELPDIVSEMAQAARVSARELKALRPGLDDVRLKLCLASRREATRVEDAAYSLFGIFSISMPVIYGEGDKALGRLLGQLLAGSGDTSVLAWDGEPGSFNSCFPDNISVFRQTPLSYIPRAEPGVEHVNIEATTTKWRMFSPRSTLPRKLYNKLNELAAPSLSSTRLRLPCITFALGPPQCIAPRHYRAKSVALGTVEIMLTEDSPLSHPLCLVHPWIDFLLDRQPVGGGIANAVPEERGDIPIPVAGVTPTPGHDDVLPSGAKKTRLEQLFIPLKRLLGAGSAIAAQDTIPLQLPSTMSRKDLRSQAQRLIARLKQPFGALLFMQTQPNAREYRRVTVDGVITVQVQDNTPLQELLDNVRVLDIL